MIPICYFRMVIYNFNDNRSCLKIFIADDFYLVTLRDRNVQPLCCINLDTATDPCMGSGSLLLNAKKYASEPGYIKYYGQELNTSTYKPSYSAKWSASAGFLQDERFSDYGVLAPKSKADYAFLLHGLYHLKNNGTMAIVLPHGVLFRGGAEGKIREKLLRSGNIYAEKYACVDSIMKYQRRIKFFNFVFAGE